MPRFGTGFPAGRRRGGTGGTSQIATIQPSAQWDGTAGSGFSSVPSDPPRTTAKPAMQMLVPPLQRYTETIIVGVLAMANEGGSMFDNLGLEKVRVHFEGTVHDIGQPRLQSLIDANGQTRAYFGWWIELEHNGVSGEAQLYFEAVPRDLTMQSRVMGPYGFFPAPQLYDFEVEVAPSKSVIANQRYQSIKDAAESLRVQGADHGHITITESGTFDLTPVNGAYSGSGYCTIDATQPVTLAKSSYVAGSGSATTNGLMRLRYDGLWLRGSNITIDTADLKQFYHESPTNPQHVFDGINITDSKGRGALWLKGQNPLPFLARGNPYYLECNVSVTQNAFNFASLVRGCQYTDGAQDAFSYARCVIGCQLTHHHNEDWRAPIDALSVSYSGNGSAATIELSGGSDTNNRVITLKEDGTTTATFQIKNDDPGYVAGTNYHVSNVVDWINGIAGWNAILLDDTRRASALSHITASSLGYAFGPVDAKAAPATLHTVFDPHGDAWALNSQSAENSIFYGNLMYQNNVPFIFLIQSGMKDIVVANNAGETDEALNPDFANMVSQWSKSSSHVVVAHNSLANQKLYLRTAIGLTADSYCMLSNNAMRAIDWLNASDSNLTIADNHLQNGASVPEGAMGTTIGGTSSDLFSDPANGDFTPTPMLGQNAKPSKLRRTRLGGSRASSAPAGSDT